MRKNLRHHKLLSCEILLLGICGFLSACGTLDEVVPASKELTWTITTDDESGPTVRRTSVVIAKGDTRNDLIAKLGSAKHVHHFRNDPSVEVIRYTHTKVGPTFERVRSTARGQMRIRAPIHFTETVEVYLKQGIVATVEVTKVEQVLLPVGREN